MAHNGGGIGSGDPMAYLKAITEKNEQTVSFLKEPQKYGYRFRYDSEKTQHGTIRALEGEKEIEGQSANCPIIKAKFTHSGQRIEIVLRLAAPQDHKVMHIYSFYNNKFLNESCCTLGTMTQQEAFLPLSDISIEQKNKKSLEKELEMRHKQTCFLKSGWEEQPGMNATQFMQALREPKNLNLEQRYSYNDYLKDLKHKSMKNRVVLALHCFLTDRTGATKVLPTIYSSEILDSKTCGFMYKINRSSRMVGQAKGGDEIWIHCDKFDSERVEIYFFDEDKWQKVVKIPKTDIFQQTIIFKTPPYRFEKLDKPVAVKYKLRDPKDSLERYSNEMDFTYKADDDIGSSARKRKVPEPTPRDYRPDEGNTQNLQHAMNTDPSDFFPMFAQQNTQQQHQQQQQDQQAYTNAGQLNAFNMLSWTFDQQGAQVLESGMSNMELSPQRYQQQQQHQEQHLQQQQPVPNDLSILGSHYELLNPPLPSQNEEINQSSDLFPQLLGSDPFLSQGNTSEYQLS